MERRRLRFGIVFAALLVLFPAATAFGGSLPASYALPGETVFPEGVAVLPGPDYFYVSSTDDGTIFRGQLQYPDAEVFLPGGQDGRTIAVGLAVDPSHGVLYVSGGPTGNVWAYDLTTRALLAQGENGRDATFVNDVTVTPDGSAYFTDSFAPVIYRLSGVRDGAPACEEWLDLTETPVVFQDGFNVNGIVATDDGAYLIIVHSALGKLYRISTEDGSTIEIDLGEDNVRAGDGLVLRGGTLVVVQNALGQVTTVRNGR